MNQHHPTAHHRPLRAMIGTVAAAAVALGMLVAVPATTITPAKAAAAAPAKSAAAAPAKAAAAAPAGSPVGHLDVTGYSPGGLTFTGWAYDPDLSTTTDAPIWVYLTVDGKRVYAKGDSTLANVYRPDLATSNPKAAQHGFRTSALLPAGTHTICLWAANTVGTPGAAVNFATCQTRTLVYSPGGKITSFKTMPGHAHLAGWAFDPDSPTAVVNVAITIDGTTVATVGANRANTDAATAHPNGGPNHGFTTTVAMAQGTHTVCAIADNIGYGSNTVLRCGQLTLAESPVGALTGAVQSSGRLRVTGWDFDPDSPATAIKTTIGIDGRNVDVVANHYRSDVAAAYPSAGGDHGFDVSFTLPEGSHRVCVRADNISYGTNIMLAACRTVVLDFTPAAALTSIWQTQTGLQVAGWAYDPDTSAPITVRTSLDGKAGPSVVAERTGSVHSGHMFTMPFPSARSGKHTVCAVGVNVKWGTHNSTPACLTITLALNPLARFEAAGRVSGSNDLLVSGWTFDPDTTAPTTVAVTVDGTAAGTYTARLPRADVLKAYPTAGSPDHGFAQDVPATAGEHTVCVTAKNVGGGKDVSLGCKIVIAVHPVAPAAPRAVTATAGYGGATISWQAPLSDGGAPWSKYTVRSSGGQQLVVSSGATSAVITGLKDKTAYTFTVTATNVAGTSVGAVSRSVTTMASPPPQTSPAPVSTSRYIRNISAATATDLSRMRTEGAADAKANPSGHGYLILLDIGGQDQYDGGVILSATTHFVSYADLVKDIDAYLDGYHSAQRSSAPVTVAIGTNNDVDVSTTSGKSWATQVVNPIRSYGARYTGITVAGANDIEPGFRATYTQTKAWLGGYLAATSAPFVFNGSADGCAWTATGRGCNNGWTMSGLYYLSAGAAPIRTLNLPQVYNNTMAAQWKYISLTGVVSGQPRINFGGPLTEWTACDQAGGCGSLTGHTAWSQMWSQLQSDSRLKVASLPYSTDLRIDR